MENTEKQLKEKKIFEELIFSISELENSYKKTKDKEAKLSMKKVLKSLNNINENLDIISDYKIDADTIKALRTIFSNGMSLDTLDILDKFRSSN
ncbi:hypothetical protein [Chryseobacterium potabilaquae]|uniref:Uncharacterized protein n=1 Tax=Chryseobacterium potabilaquae TaxID=2675057 RepID=A0A6N4XCG0_9FLAO|nr:hypothetical protein [Chryseobacterium potabilaquae]CAA7197439.1 hypothetical protein CHRY9293_03498 [Chryseobacterium potabilaquae]